MNCLIDQVDVKPIDNPKDVLLRIEDDKIQERSTTRHLRFVIIKLLRHLKVNIKDDANDKAIAQALAKFEIFYRLGEDEGGLRSEAGGPPPVAEANGEDPASEAPDGHIRACDAGGLSSDELVRRFSPKAKVMATHVEGGE